MLCFWHFFCVFFCFALRSSLIKPPSTFLTFFAFTLLPSSSTLLQTLECSNTPCSWCATDYLSVTDIFLPFYNLSPVWEGFWCSTTYYLFGAPVVDVLQLSSSGPCSSCSTTYNRDSSVVQCGTHDRKKKVKGSSPSRSGRRIFFSRVNFLCWLLFHCLLDTVLP